MTQATTKRPPWHGGNRIPASYLKRFLPSQGRTERDDLPHDLRFLGNGNGHTETADCNGESEGLEAHAVISLLRRGAALMMRRNMAASAAGTK